MGKKFKKMYQQTNEIRKDAEKATMDIQCECPHQDEDGYDNVDIVTKGDVRALRCNDCKKIIALKPPTKDDTTEASNTIDTALDYLKMKCNPKSEKQAKIIKAAANTQKALRKLIPAYNQMITENANKEKKNKYGRRGGAIMRYND